ncbi:uncharacterized protein APUU_70015A [Aspergillus puulaauensis]|uniref:Asl1-like glycosyl hydrolase catalytic domain-containing protein n=1 Tax=Aspergillus puulaauensis TaxID=1220207 RepID=A0A7R7XVG3_9EURO|nr:uncharacterized protein APUU_70015A [Aspergillus puulaauensis]BCS28445.1 hypothetical protein APUU_70015A [Aspergillus puulaauensis]
MRFTPQISLALTMAMQGVLTIPSATARCSEGLVNIVFNDNYTQSQLAQVTGATNWLTFRFGTAPKQIPMLPQNKEGVDKAIAAVTGPNPPDYLLTFNEPDLDYKTGEEQLSATDAAELIAPLLKKRGTHTKLIAPVLANQTKPWLDDFYRLCKCQDAFDLYNVHIYRPTVAEAKAEVQTFRDKFNDKPLWISEIAPAHLTGSCPTTIPWDKSLQFMQEIYAWGETVDWIHKIFWNSGNEIHCSDTNVAASFLVDKSDKPTPLLKPFNELTCS